MVYQEQVMQAAQILAGYTLGGADLLRRAMGKKKAEEMAKQRAIFVAGAKKTNNIAEGKANQLFDVLDKFAGYGFNKAHAACYGVLAYQTAYLKARYPVQFMAALLSNELGNTDKIAIFEGEARRMGIAVLPPNVNSSGAVFTVTEGSIRFGLSAIKNVGSAAVDLIVAARKEGGPFEDMFDLCCRIGSRLTTRNYSRAWSSPARATTSDQTARNWPRRSMRRWRTVFPRNGRRRTAVASSAPRKRAARSEWRRRARRFPTGRCASG